MAFNRAKPDDRSDNAEKLEEMIQNTKENIEKAEETMEFSDGENKAEIESKNDRRRESIQGMQEELKDETNAQQNHYH